MAPYQRWRMFVFGISVTFGVITVLSTVAVVTAILVQLVRQVISHW